MRKTLSYRLLSLRNKTTWATTEVLVSFKGIVCNETKISQPFTPIHITTKAIPLLIWKKLQPRTIGKLLDY